MTKMSDQGQSSSNYIPLDNKYQSIYEQLKINKLLPLDQTNQEQLKVFLSRKIDDDELEHFLLFAKLQEENSRLKESLFKKDHALVELFKRLTFAKRDIAKDTIESQLQLLFSYMIGKRILELYDSPIEIKQYFQTLFNETENQLVKLQNNSMELYPVSLDELGVIPSIKSYYKYKKLHAPAYLPVTFLGSLGRYDGETEIMVFRYVQQVLDTLERDTEATELTIQFQEGNDGQITCIFKGNASHTDLSKHKDFILFNEVIDSFSGSVEQESSANSFEIRFSIQGHILSQS